MRLYSCQVLAVLLSLSSYWLVLCGFFQLETRTDASSSHSFQVASSLVTVPFDRQFETFSKKRIVMLQVRPIKDTLTVRNVRVSALLRRQWLRRFIIWRLQWGASTRLGDPGEDGCADHCGHYFAVEAVSSRADRERGRKAHGDANVTSWPVHTGSAVRVFVYWHIELDEANNGGSEAGRVQSRIYPGKFTCCDRLLDDQVWSTFSFSSQLTRAFCAFSCYMWLSLLYFNQ